LSIIIQRLKEVIKGTILIQNSQKKLKYTIQEI